jgi:hypothetical protein
MVMNIAGFGTNNDCAGEDKQEFIRERIVDGATKVALHVKIPPPPRRKTGPSSKYARL